VRLVQPNAPQDQKWDPDKAMVFFDRQLADTAAPKTGGVAEIVWPESAVPWLLDYAAPALERIADAAEGVPVILGLNREAGGRYYNAMVTVGPGGEPGEVYDKVHLVPFGEYIPFGGLARLIGLQSFAAREGYGFSAGQRVHLIDTPLGKALPLICYEAIFPQGMFAAGERPDYLLQITNDAWFGTFSGPFQHLQQARFRAAEQGLPLVRVANTGVSAVIDYTGQVTAMLPMGKAAYLDADLPSGRRVTLYSRTGDGPVAALLAAFWAVLLALGARNTIAKRGRLS